MKNLAITIVLAAVIWHISFFVSSGSHLIGLFRVEPDAGYTWANENDSNPHYFWENTEAVWFPGMNHPNFNVVSTEEENNWKPLPGYTYVNSDPGDLSTQWTPGLKHQSMNAFTSKEEGFWEPALGYKFEYDANGSIIATTWNSGQRFESMKIIASQNQDYFIPFPGYSFPDPEKSLSVVWTPGLVNSENPDIIAAAVEGQWEKTPSVNEVTADEQIAGGFLMAFAANVMEWVGGENSFSNHLKEEAAKEVIIGTIKKLQ